MISRGMDAPVCAKLGQAGAEHQMLLLKYS